MRKQFVIGVIFLFIFSIITPMVFGVNIQNSNENEPQLASSGNGGLMNNSWPMFGHDNQHTGRSPYGSEGKYLVEKWRFKLAGDWAHTPIIDRNGTIYICATYNDVNGKGLVQAVNPDGTEKWRLNTGGHIRHVSPAIAEDGTIYFGDDSGYLHALRDNNGMLKWKIKLKGGIYSSPAIADDGTIYIGASNSINAIYPNSTIKWTYNTGDTISSSPAIDSNGIVYVSSQDEYLYAFYNNGSIKWSKKIGRWSSSPTIGDNGIIYIGASLKFYAINQNGSTKWSKTDLQGLFTSSPAIDYDGTIYSTTSGFAWIHPVYAFNPNGAIKWKNEIELTSHSVAINKYSNIFLGADYCLDSRAYVLSPTDGHTVNNLPLFTFSLGGPAIGPNGIVYYGSEKGYLHAIEFLRHAPELKINLKGKMGHLEVEFENVGDVTAQNISYSVSVDPQFPIFRPNFNGEIPSLEPGKTLIRNAWFIWGFWDAHIEIKITAPGANYDQINEIWNCFGPFIFDSLNIQKI